MTDSPDPRPTTRDLLIARLRQGPATADQLAQALGVTPNGIRAQLASLERDGWVRPGRVRRDGSVGKPAMLYELTIDGEVRLSRAYVPVLKALVQTLADRESPARRTALYRAAGRRLTEGFPVGASATVAAGVATATKVLGALGGSVASVDVGRSVTTIVGAGCPIGEAVKVDPLACAAVVGLLAGVTGLEVSERCDRGARPACRLELARRARPQR